MVLDSTMTVVQALYDAAHDCDLPRFLENLAEDCVVDLGPKAGDAGCRTHMGSVAIGDLFVQATRRPGTSATWMLEGLYGDGRGNVVALHRYVVRRAERIITDAREAVIFVVVDDLVHSMQRCAGEFGSPCESTGLQAPNRSLHRWPTAVRPAPLGRRPRRAWRGR